MDAHAPVMHNRSPTVQPVVHTQMQAQLSQQASNDGRGYPPGTRWLRKNRCQPASLDRSARAALPTAGQANVMHCRRGLAPTGSCFSRRRVQSTATAAPRLCPAASQGSRSQVSISDGQAGLNAAPAMLNSHCSSHQRPLIGKPSQNPNKVCQYHLKVGEVGQPSAAALRLAHQCNGLSCNLESASPRESLWYWAACSSA